MHHTALNQTNQIFGTLKAIEPTEERRHSLIVWKLECTKCKKIVFRVPSWCNEKTYCGNSSCRPTNRRAKDFTGHIWGTLEAINPTTKYYEGNRSFIWELKCIKCDIRVFKVPSTLNEHSTCGNIECKIGISLKDLKGQKFGRLTVVKLRGRDKNEQVSWDCVCVCGNKRIQTTTKLVTGIATGCGCLKEEMSRKPPGEASWNSRWGHFLDSSCKDRNLNNELTKEFFIEISSKNCFYCDAVPKAYNVYAMATGETKPSYKNNPMKQETLDRAWIHINGIDRVDNEIGYLINNTVPCCWDCNKMKSGSKFYKWCSFIEKFKFGFTKETLEKMEKLGIKIPPK